MHATLVVKIETHMALHPPLPSPPVSDIKSLLSPDVIHNPVVTWRRCVSVDQPVAPSTSTVLLLYLEMQTEEKCAAH